MLDLGGLLSRGVADRAEQECGSGATLGRAAERLLTPMLEAHLYSDSDRH